MLVLTQGESRSRLQQLASAELRLTMGLVCLAAELLLVPHCRRRLAAGHPKVESLGTDNAFFQCA